MIPFFMPLEVENTCLSRSRSLSSILSSLHLHGLLRTVAIIPLILVKENPYIYSRLILCGRVTRSRLHNLHVALSVRAVLPGILF